MDAVGPGGNPRETFARYMFLRLPYNKALELCCEMPGWPLIRWVIEICFRILTLSFWCTVIKNQPFEYELYRI